MHNKIECFIRSILKNKYKGLESTFIMYDDSIHTISISVLNLL